MKNHKYKTIFSSKVKCLIDEEKDKFLSLASVENLKPFLPKVDLEKNYDLLPIAFNAFTVNRVNRNADVIDTKTALAVVDNFITKPLDLEHVRTNVCGVILTVGFSKFGSDEPLEKKDIENTTDPFNVTLGAVVWKICHPDLIDLLEESNDPDSEHYLSISASWELGFSENNLIILPKGQKNIATGKVISDPDEVEKLSKNLKSLGGSGKIGNDFIYRQPIGDVLPLAIGLTGQPAADVKGILVAQDPIKIQEQADEATKNNENTHKFNENTDDSNNLNDKNDVSAKIIEENANIISHSENTNVKIIDKNMKITNVKDITDESLKQMSASNISEFVNDELSKAADKFKEEKNAKELAVQEKANLIASQAEITKELEKVKASLKTLEDEKQAKAKQELFDSRMANLDKEYDLTDEDRQVLASQIKDLTDESFASFEKGVKVLMKEKNKTFKNEQIEAAKKKAAPKKPAPDAPGEDGDDTDDTGDDQDSDEDKKAAKKKKKSAKAADEEVVANVIDEGKEVKDVPNAADVAVKSLKDKYKDAFAFENCVSNKRK